MTMQAGRVGDRDIRAKMAELRLITDKEIEIHQRRQEAAVLSLRKSLQSIKFDAQETVLNQDKIGKLKAQLRAVEDDLVKALSVKTRKEAKKMAIADSISATKARLEEHKKIVADQRTRKDEFAAIISESFEALKENEEKHSQDAERREEIEEAISWYNRVLGFRIETGHGIKFIFSNINKKNPNEEYYFTIRLENDIYSLLDCHPNVSEVKKLIHELNATNGLYRFVRTMRAKFQEVSAVGIDLIFYTLWYNGIGEGMEWNGSFHSILLSLPLGVGSPLIVEVQWRRMTLEKPGKPDVFKGYNRHFSPLDLLHLYAAANPHGLRQRNEDEGCCLFITV
uniref:Kinetochore protein SPC25 n=1 Tax=Lactuca sativa TaxID=4236 RepID=A0A9R1VEG5_LACSA|nr:hypothetical protein LSAT_V11C500234380 [Lactuca sativa]